MNPKRLYGSLSICKRSLPHNLPSELLSYIFSIATDCCEERYEAILTPITMSHVCSRWREVAISAGGLWTKFSLTFPTYRGQLSRTMTWLSRSRTYPIDILLDFRDPLWDWDEHSHVFHWQDMESIVRLFLTHVKRWHHFELLTDTWAPIFTFLWYTRGVESAPLLRSISLSRCNAYFASKGEIFQPVELKEPIPLFGGLTLNKLRDVSLSGVHVDWARSSLRDLTKLELRYLASDVIPSKDEFIDILAGCSDLRHLSITGWGPRFDKVPIPGSTSGNEDVPKESRRTIQPIQLRHLLSFSLGFVDVNYALKLLSLFSFPSIETLALEDVSFSLNPFERQDATPILDWLAPIHESSDSSKRLSHTRHGFLGSIISLQLHGIHSNESAFSNFFLALPSLQHLGVTGIPDNALHALAPHPSSETTSHRYPCPALRKLDCRNVDCTILVDVVRSRGQAIGVSPLDAVSFDSSSDNAHHPTPADRLKLNEAGIKVLCGPTEIS